VARLDRPAPVREIAQIGAAIGREFSYPLVRALVGRDETALKGLRLRVQTDHREVLAVPRKSRSERDFDLVAPRSPMPPIAPPASLSVPARAVFLDLVSSHEPEHFEPGDVTLLAQYCEACALATKAAVALQAGDASQLRIWERSAAVMASLSLRLRLGPQSRRERARAGAQLTWSDRYRLDSHGARRPWEQD
jgi:hypothetical protein